MISTKDFLRAIFGTLILILFPISYSSASYDAEAGKFFNIINSYRAANGRAALLGDVLLQNAASWMSADMVSNCVPNRFCTHTDSLGRALYERLQSFGYLAGSTNDTLRGGEIIAWNINGNSTAEDAFGWWKNSSMHNENMLRDSYAATGISRSCEGGYCAWAVTFGGKALQPFNNSITDPQSLSDGVLIRAVDGIDIYIIKNKGAKKFKRLILNPSVFENYGHLKWSNVKSVDQLVLDSFETSDLARAAGDVKVYKLNSLGDTGEKRWIPTLEIFNQFNFDWNAVYEINSFDRDSYATGADWE